MTPQERVSLSRAENQPEKKALEDIRSRGIHWLSVFDPNDADRGFCYSVGLWHTHNHPEVIIFGLNSELSGRVLNEINSDIRDGKSFQAGLSSMDCLDGFRCYFETFPKEQYRNHLGWAKWFYGGDDFPTVQMLWPTKLGVYPWEANASEQFKKMQPVFSNIPLRVS
jgi:hypothetical protein